MSKIIINVWAGVLFAFCTVAHATDVSGLISTSTDWNTAGSPYIVTGNILVDTLTTLTIQPGVEVRLDSAKCIMVKGTLSAIGTATDSVIITKNGTARWARLWLKNASMGSFKYCRVEYADSSAIANDNTSLFDSLYIGYCTISNNSTGGGDGGGISTNGLAIITNNTISNNSASYNGGGGGISTNGSATITNNTISNNSASGGGGIFNRGLATITNNAISNNSAGGGGGGIFTDGGSATITNNTISNNSAGGGGGISTQGGSDTITNNTIANNSASYGGGIYNNGGNSGSATITNNTISNNHAPSSYGGGGIYNASGLATMRYNTITDSTSSAIYLSSGAAFIRTNNIFTTGYALYNGTTSDMDARYNYWNSVNTDTINAKIFDYYDDFTKGVVYYRQFLKAPFTDTVAPSAPLNLTATINPDSTFVITWTNPSDPSGISEYYYKTGSAPGFNFDTTGRFHGALDTVPYSSRGMLYVWLVDSSGNLNYQNSDSVMLSFTETGIRGRKNNADIHLSFSVISGISPTDHVLQYDLPEKAQVSLVLFDISGKLVKTLYSGMRESGCYTQTLQESALSAGMYYVRFQAGEFTSAKRYTVLR